MVYMDALNRLGRDYDGIISEWKYITRELNADIVCLDNETLFDSRKFKTMGDFGKLLEDQFLSMLAYVAEQERKKNRQRQAEGIEVARAEGVTDRRWLLKKKHLLPLSTVIETNLSKLNQLYTLEGYGGKIDGVGRPT